MAEITQKQFLMTVAIVLVVVVMTFLIGYTLGGNQERARQAAKETAQTNSASSNSNVGNTNSNAQKPVGPVSTDIANSSGTGSVSDTSSSYVVPQGWATYEGLGFRMSYPATWDLNKALENDGVISLDLKSATNKAGYMPHAIQVTVYNSTKELPNNTETNLSFEEWIAQKAGDYGFVSRSTISIDGVKGYKGLSKGESQGDYMQMVEKNGKIYEIVSLNPGSADQISIVKSFRFVK